MVFIPAWHKFNEKPRNANRINWDSIFSDNLLAFFLPDNENYELVKGLKLTSKLGSHLLTGKNNDLVSTATFQTGEWLEHKTGFVLTDTISMMGGFIWDGNARTGTDEHALLRQSSGTGYYSLGLYTTGPSRLRALVRTDGTTGWTGANDVNQTFTAGKNHSFSAVYKNGQNLKIFFDGVLLSTKTVTGSLTGDSTATLKFNGAENTINRPISGWQRYGALWKRALSNDEVSELNINPWQILKPRVVYFDFGSSGITLSPPFLSDSDTFHAPTVTPGAITLSPPLLSDADTFHNPTVTVGTLLQAPFLSDGDTFHNPTITVGGITLLAPYFDAGDTFHSPTVTGGDPVETGIRFQAQHFIYNKKGKIKKNPLRYTRFIR